MSGACEAKGEEEKTISDHAESIGEDLEENRLEISAVVDASECQSHGQRIACFWMNPQKRQLKEIIQL